LATTRARVICIFAQNLELLAGEGVECVQRTFRMLRGNMYSFKVEYEALFAGFPGVQHVDTAPVRRYWRTGDVLTSHKSSRVGAIEYGGDWSFWRWTADDPGSACHSNSGATLAFAVSGSNPNSYSDPGVCVGS